MAACTFFGHRDSSDTLFPMLLKAIEDLIENHQVNQFFIGHQGAFDGMALEAVTQLSEKYPHIRYAVVLAYLPLSSNAARHIHPAARK